MTVIGDTARAADAAQSAARAATRAARGATASAARAAEAAGTATVKVPANLMALVRQSYDTREKVYDWILAFAVVGGLTWAYRDTLRDMLTPSGDPNAGRADPPEPSQNVLGALPWGQRARAGLYTYNMPAARNIQYGIDPSNGTRPPLSPQTVPDYSVVTERP